MTNKGIAIPMVVIATLSFAFGLAVGHKIITVTQTVSIIKEKADCDKQGGLFVAESSWGGKSTYTTCTRPSETLSQIKL